MSPQKRAAWIRRLSILSRPALLVVKAEIERLLKSGSFDPETEIASAHSDPSLVCRTITDQGHRKLQEIYCCQEHCQTCPHGPFWFNIKQSKTGKVKVRFTGTPALPPDLLEKMNDDIQKPSVYIVRTDSN